MIGDLAAGSTMSGSVRGWRLWTPWASNWPARSNDRNTGPWKVGTEIPILPPTPALLRRGRQRLRSQLTRR